MRRAWPISGADRRHGRKGHDPRLRHLRCRRAIDVRCGHLDDLHPKAQQDGFQCALEHLDAVRGLRLGQSPSLENSPRLFKLMRLCSRLFPCLCHCDVPKLVTCVTECLALRRRSGRDRISRQYLECEYDEVLLRGRHERG